MRILQIISQEAIKSGGSIQMYRLSKELVKRGHKVTAIFGDNKKYRKDFKIFDNTGVEVLFFDIKRFKLDGKTIRNIFKLKNFIKEEKFDVIHSHKGADLNYLVLGLLGIKIPIIANRGMSNKLTTYNSLKYKCSKVFKIVAVAEKVKKIMMESGNISENKIEVVYGSVDIEEFHPKRKSEVRKEFKIKEDKIVIGYVGSALPRKGIQYLIESFKILSKKRENTILFLVGVTKEALENFDIPKEIEDKVIPAGFRWDVADCMVAMDIFVFSGISDEGLTGTVREAAAMSLPIVTTDVAGNRELIYDMETGVLVKKADSIALKNGLELLLNNEELSKKMGENARKFVKENMSVKVRADKIEKIYKEAIEMNKK